MLTIGVGEQGIWSNPYMMKINRFLDGNSFSRLQFWIFFCNDQTVLGCNAFLQVCCICTRHSLFGKHLCSDLPKQLKYAGLQVPCNLLWQPAEIYHHNSFKLCLSHCSWLNRNRNFQKLRCSCPDVLWCPDVCGFGIRSNNKWDWKKTLFFLTESIHY